MAEQFPLPRSGFKVLRHMLRAIAPTVPATAVVLAVRVLAGGERTGPRAIAELALYAIAAAAATWLFERALVSELLAYMRGRRPQRTWTAIAAGQSSGA